MREWWEFKSFKIFKKEYWDFKWEYIAEIKFDKWTENFLLKLDKQDTDNIFKLIKDKIPDVLNNIINNYKKELWIKHNSKKSLKKL